MILDTPDRADVLALDIVDSAIDNVLENAIVHADTDRPAVDVGLSAGEAWVELRIADRGPGIPQQELTALERGDEAPLTHSSGLGLWLTEWIVSESGGTLRFETNEPSGTVVSMTFRAASVEAETEE
jgi:signal transduction histidine kinase